MKPGRREFLLQTLGIGGLAAHAALMAPFSTESLPEPDPAPLPVGDPTDEPPKKEEPPAEAERPVDDTIIAKRSIATALDHFERKLFTWETASLGKEAKYLRRGDIRIFTAPTFQQQLGEWGRLAPREGQPNHAIAFCKVPDNMQEKYGPRCAIFGWGGSDCFHFDTWSHDVAHITVIHLPTTHLIRYDTKMLGKIVQTRPPQGMGLDEFAFWGDLVTTAKADYPSYLDWSRCRGIVETVAKQLTYSLHAIRDDDDRTRHLGYLLRTIKDDAVADEILEELQRQLELYPVGYFVERHTISA